MLLPIIAHLLLYLAPAAHASLWASWLPLVVRSPYTSTWMNATNVPYDPNNVDGVRRAPTVWSQCLESQVIALFRVARTVTKTCYQDCSLAGLIRIDQARTYAWLGNPGDNLAGINRSILTSIQVTPTRTTMNMTAGPLDLSFTFLSPIEVCTAYVAMPKQIQTILTASRSSVAITALRIHVVRGEVE